MAGTLWLVPGHLGQPEDVSLRAVRLLGQARLLLVESGSDKALDALVRTVRCSLPGRRLDLDPSPDTVAAVVGVLNDGGDVVVFGGDEGIPCFMDPGLDLVRGVRDALPDVAVRSVGGASVLGTALMRLERKADTFLFLGSIQQADEATVDRIARSLRWAALDQATLVVFTNGQAAKAMQRGLAARPPHVIAETNWLVSLTKDTEVVHQGTVGHGHDEVPDVDDDAPLVWVLTARHDPRHRTGPLQRWAERWWRGAFDLRI